MHSKYNYLHIIIFSGSNVDTIVLVKILQRFAVFRNEQLRSVTLYPSTCPAAIHSPTLTSSWSRSCVTVARSSFSLSAVCDVSSSRARSPSVNASVNSTHQKLIVLIQFKSADTERNSSGKNKINLINYDLCNGELKCMK